MLRTEIFQKKGFVGCKSQVFVIGDKNAGRGVRIAEARRHGDDFDWPRSFCEYGGDFAGDQGGAAPSPS